MRNLFLTLFLLLLLLFSLTAVSCQQNAEFSSEESLEITLPTWPPEDSLSACYPALSRWKIKVSDALSSHDFFTCENQITITVKKNRPLSITALPITLLEDGRECSYFMPAGFIYPNSSERKAGWEEGFLAHIMEQLFTQGRAEAMASVDIEYLIASFNWKKALQTIDTKLQSDKNLFYNPWLLDKRTLLDGIASGSFKATYLTLKGSTSLEEAQILEKCTSGSASELQIRLLSSFIPENLHLEEKKQFTVIKNTPILIADAKRHGLFITVNSSKKISFELIFMPIYIGDI